MIELAVFAIYFALIIWIVDLFSRSTETQTRLSAGNPKMIKPDVVCTNKHALTRPVINDGFSTTSGDDLNQQSFLRLKAKVEEKNLILLENERLANELSLLQSKLTDSSSKLQMFQNVHDELATTKSELENNKRVMTDMKEKNLRLKNDDSRLRRKIEDRDRLIASSRAELENLQTSNDQKLDKVHDLLAVTKRKLQSKNEEVGELQSKNLRLERNDKRLRQKLEETNLLLVSSRAEVENLRVCLAEQQLDKVHGDLAAATREIASKNRTITELETQNLRLAENDSQLRRKMEETDRLLLSSQAETEQLRVSLDNQSDTIEQLLNQLSSQYQEKNEAVRKLDKQKQMKPKLTADVGCGSDEVIHHNRIEEPIPPAMGISQIVTDFLAFGLTAQADSPGIVTSEAQPVDLSEIFPAITLTGHEAVKVSTEHPPAEFSISSTIEKEVYVDRIVVTGITNKDCGRVVGRNGSNVKRIEEKYWVRVSFIKGNLLITGGDAESRLAACTDVIENLPVTMECPKLDLRNSIFSNNYLLRELAFNHTVHIYRPSQENKFVTIWGKIDNCRTVYKILQNGSR
jgi:hypothetical protein